MLKLKEMLKSLQIILVLEFSRFVIIYSNISMVLIFVWKVCFSFSAYLFSMVLMFPG